MLSRHNVGTYLGNELTRNSSGNALLQSSQLAEPLWIEPGLKGGIGVRELIYAQRERERERERDIHTHAHIYTHTYTHKHTYTHTHTHIHTHTHARARARTSERTYACMP